MDAIVSDLRRYPVKGLGGESLESVELTEIGIAWDRTLALPSGRAPLQPPGNWTAFEAFFVLKNRGDIGRLSAHINPRGAGVHEAKSIEVLRAGSSVATVPIVGTSPRLTEHDTVSAWIGSEDEQQQAFCSGVPLWDAEEAHVSIINLATVRAIGAAMGVDLDPLRFRANVYIDGLAPWAEFEWVGRPIKLGSAQLVVFSSIERCRATSSPPGANGWDLNVPGALAGYFGHLQNGIYARLTKIGSVRIGDVAAPIGTFSPQQLLMDEPDEVAVAPRFAEIVAIEHTTESTWSLTFEDPYGLLNSGNAGQHLRVHRLDEAPDWRNYTISGASDVGARITVRRESAGRFSPWITNLAVGDKVALSGPHGTAHIDTETTTSVVVLTAGIGITPALAIAQALAATNSERSLHVVHVDRTHDAIPHLDELTSNVQSLANGHLHIFLTGQEQIPASSHRGRPSAEFVSQLLGDPNTVSVFACGPKPFLSSMTNICHGHGVPRSAIYIDPFYSPPVPNLEPLSPPMSGPFTVRWPDQTASTWTSDCGTLLELAEAAGLRPPAGCRSGACGTCEATVSGQTFALLDTFVEPDDGRALLCSSVPVGDVEITSFS